jgi:pimeloyl-ACP methyl ester carboxylesterase
VTVVGNVSEPLPMLLVPGLLCSPRLYAGQIPALWRLGSVTIADHTRDDSVAGIARRILANAPPRFALIGLSMGGYVAFEILRQTPERVARLVLLDTSARPDTAEQTAGRRAQIALATSGHLAEVVRTAFANSVHPAHRADDGLRQVFLDMAAEVGVDAFVRQQLTNIGRPDSRPQLGAIRCPTLVLVGDSDQLTPPDRAAEIVAGIGGARLVIVPESGHSSTLEQPEFVAKSVVEFLRE